MKKEASIKGLHELGYPDDETVMEKCFNKKNCIAVIAAPTGEGKTTTLYSALALLNKPEVNITTVEDPVKTEKRDYRNDTRRRMTYKEKREFEQLDIDIPRLTAEKEEIERLLSSGTLSVERITELSKRLPALTAELDEKEMRWLELSEI